MAEISIIVRAQDAASRGLLRISNVADGLGSAIDNAAGALDAIDSVMNGAGQRADKLARKQLDVDQAMADVEQAANDLEQAHIDLNQAQLDGQQAGIDVEQAQIDAKQAMLDAATAQKDYNAAVKEFGPNSAEAKQASIDLTQANADLKQANLDAEQAAADLEQANADGTQAMDDMAQAVIDGKGAQLDLNEAQRELDPTNLAMLSTKMAEFGPLLMAAVGATQVMTSAMAGLNLALLANPIGLVVVAVAALAAGMVLLWKKSQTAREVMSTAFAGIASAVLTNVEMILKVYRELSNGVLVVVEQMLRALGKIPGNDWAKRAADDVKEFRDDTREFFDGAIKKTQDWRTAAQNLPKKIKLEGDIADLSKKIDRAKARLKERGLTDPQRTKIRADIAQLERSLARARAKVNALKGKTITINTRYTNSGSGSRPGGGTPIGMAHGGIRGAADGGGRSGLTLTGEAGPELLDLPPGTRVRTNPDTRRMLGAGSGSREPVVLELRSGGSRLDDLLVEMLRKSIRARGGNAQVVLSS